MERKVIGTIISPPTDPVGKSLKYLGPQIAWRARGGLVLHGEEALPYDVVREAILKGAGICYPLLNPHPKALKTGPSIHPPW